MDERESLAVDVYLDGLLARRGGARPRAMPMAADLQPSMRATAELLDRSLLRFHPSFLFEEGLAERLRAEAEGRLFPGPPGRLLTFPGLSADLPRPSGDFETDQDEGDRRARSLLVGGAIASGVSLAGAALLAWRRGRGPAVATGASRGAGAVTMRRTL